MRKLKKILWALFIWGLLGSTIFLFGKLSARLEVSALKSKIEALTNQNDKMAEKNPLKIIKIVCDENGVDWTACVSVATLASHLDRYFRKEIIAGQYKGSEDRGIFAINSKAYKNISDDCAYDVWCSAQVFCDAVKVGHLGDWLEAKTLKLVK